MENLAEDGEKHMTATPLKLTYAGEQYLKRAKVILGQMEDINRELRDITHNMTGRLRIGFPSERIVYMLPLILKPLKDRYSGIDVEVSTGPGNGICHAVHVARFGVPVYARRFFHSSHGFTVQRRDEYEEAEQMILDVLAAMK